MHSAIYEGWVRHRRYRPIEHSFRYKLFMMYLDLAELDDVFDRRWLWSTTRPNVAWFRRADHLGDPDVPLDVAVRDLVEERTGERPAGSIRLLTHLRYFGYVMNPVSFYYCFDADDTRLDTIVAEVHNTPWGERHCYVLDERLNTGSEHKKKYQFAKDFHVSPFMGMDQHYDWQFLTPGKELAVNMANEEDGQHLFDATMVMQRTPATAWHLARVLIGYPLMTVKVIAAIYWQALKLWWKGAKYHPHPRTYHGKEQTKVSDTVSSGDETAADTNTTETPQGKGQDAAARDAA